MRIIRTAKQFSFRRRWGLSEPVEVALDESGDIYAQLLGIAPGRRPPNYYALLAISPSESDAKRIHAAARRQIGRLSPFLGSEHAQAAQQIMAEIATARAVLTAPTGKERYDAKLREQPDFVPNAIRPPEAILEDILPRDEPGPTAIPKSNPMGAAPIIEEQSAEPDDATPKNPRWANEVAPPPLPPNMPAAAPTVAKARLVSGPGTAFNNELPPSSANDTPLLPPTAIGHEPAAWHPAADGDGHQPFRADTYSAPSPVRRTARRGGIARERSQMALILLLLCMMAAVGLGAGAVLVWQARNERVAGANQETPIETGAAAKAAPTSQSASRSDDSKTLSATDRVKPEAKPASPVTEDGTTARDRGLTASPMKRNTESPPAVTPKADMPPPDRAKPPPMADENPEQAASVRKSLKAARDAIALCDLTKVDELLDVALIDASTDSLRAEVERVRILRTSVGSFWNAVRESLKTITGGTELEVDGDVIIVVEVSRDRDRLVARIKGQNRDFRVEQLPTELATGLAERWLAKDDVNSRAFVGAYLATSAREQYIDRGRAVLREAQSAGSEVARAVLEALDR
ncbi:MAG TPA: hypothetical protein VGN12_22000 [Pirellulales bacterium]|jgi:hypothetical protein